MSPLMMSVFQLGAKRLNRVEVQSSDCPASGTWSISSCATHWAITPSFWRAPSSLPLVSTTSLPGKPASCSCRMRCRTVSEPAR